ncbi:hypothetical protein IFM89_026705 [Coptis chinensis]|uniref:Pectinesterase catalytic domain-containing protein n=1 Tax=Coptis chinensis TaxID=261450 RepID=A0A835IYH7_9MAGN|nr:hypothetical protein IFM89_026705 [Coptis chinensis]
METFIPSFINPENVYYGEFNNTGPGANVLERVRWPGFAVLSRSDASKFTVHQFFANFDWLATTGIPYWLDLITFDLPDGDDPLALYVQARLAAAQRTELDLSLIPGLVECVAIVDPVSLALSAKILLQTKSLDARAVN